MHHHPFLADLVDWPTAIRLAGNNKEMAQTLLELFVQNLPRDKQNLSFAFAQGDMKKLLQYLHHMHGALCYLGLPRLKSIVQELEVVLKNNNFDNLATLMHKLKQEIDYVLASVAS